MMTRVIVCEMPAGTRREELEPFPGSKEARLMGCTCPHEHPWWPRVRFAESCPVHVLELVKPS